MPRDRKSVTIEDVTIAFRNFAGKEDIYNRAGDRNFAIMLDPELAEKLERDGWNVKTLKAREEGDEPQPYLQVAVSYKLKPPKIAIVTSKGLSYIGEDLVETLDWVDIETADVTLNPYEWAVGDKHGVKAYLQTLYMKVLEDYLQLKWESYIQDQKQLPSSNEDVIEGEFVEFEETRQIEGAR